jgi:hypothetical protein
MGKTHSKPLAAWHDGNDIRLHPLSLCIMDEVVVASLSLRRPRFKCIPGHVLFVVDVGCTGAGFTSYSSLFPVNIIALLFSPIHSSAVDAIKY